MCLTGRWLRLVCEMFIVCSSINIPSPRFSGRLLQWSSSTNVSLWRTRLSNSALSTHGVIATQVVDEFRTVSQLGIVGMLRLRCTYRPQFLIWSLHIHQVIINSWHLSAVMVFTVKNFTWFCPKFCDKLRLWFWILKKKTVQNCSFGVSL